jgi:fatty acid desaturase
MPTQFVVDEPQAVPKGTYTQDYVDLKKQVKAVGLMARQPLFYTAATLEVVLMLAASITFLFVVDNFWLQLLNALFMSLAFVRAGFMMHDCGHRQVFKKARHNDLFGLLFSNFVLGSSISSWRTRHNEHHAHTNELGVDPTLEIPLWAWIEEQAAEQPNGVVQWFMKYQALTFFPVLSLSGFFQAFAAFKDVFFTPRVEDRLLQGGLLILHHVVYFALLFAALPWWGALIFFFVHYLATGLHLGLVFAPNHKGMPIVDPDHGLDFLYVQAATTRNVIPGPLVDYLYGGLNYQIEHHLFPGMPRINLGRAQVITKAFLEARGFPYYETGVIRSYREILSYMHQVGANLRAGQGQMVSTPAD